MQVKSMWLSWKVQILWPWVWMLRLCKRTSTAICRKREWRWRKRRRGKWCTLRQQFSLKWWSVRSGSGYKHWWLSFWFSRQRLKLYFLCNCMLATTCIHLCDDICYTPTQATEKLVQICFATILNIKIYLMGKSHIHFHKKVLIIFVQLTLNWIHGEICSTSGHVQGLSYPFCSLLS